MCVNTIAIGNNTSATRSTALIPPLHKNVECKGWHMSPPSTISIDETISSIALVSVVGATASQSTSGRDDGLSPSGGGKGGRSITKG